MSVADCLVRLRDEGKITPPVAKAARDLWERYQNRFSLDMPAAQADAAAALQAARELSQSTKARKHSVAMQTIRQTAVEQAQMAHKWGPAAGGMAILTRDIYRTGAANVDTRTQTIREALFSRFNAGLEAYKSRLLGLKQDISGAQNMVRELFNVDTGDELAKIAAKGWQDAVKFGTDYVKAAGKVFEANEDWRLPQAWASDRVRSIGADAFKADVRKALDSGGLQMFDKERFEVATDPARVAALLDKAARDIITEAGNAPVFSKEMRTFNFQDGAAGAQAFIDLQGKYGSGQDILSTLRSHLGGMAREGALVDILGPQHAATAKMLEKNARVADRLGEGGSPWRPQRWIANESGKGIERTYDVLSGRANGVENAMMAGIAGGARSLATGAMLGSSVIPAVVGDSVTALLASRWNGMDFGRVLARAIEDLGPHNPQAQEDAARLLVTAHAVSDHAVGTVRYADQLVGPQLLKRTAAFVVRASGLDAWTEGIKKAFTMEMLGLVARQTGRGFDAVDEPFRNFLTRYQITPAEWEAIRAAPLQEVGGAKFFDSSKAANDPLFRKIYEGILQERAFAVLEPDARVRANTTAGTKAGTLMGEVTRSLTLFTSFSQTMIMTHMMRLATMDGSLGTKMGNAIWFLGLHLAAGAAILQARSVISGKDPIDMHNPKFWMQSAIQGGGLGYFGDLVSNAVEGISGRSITGKLSGPVGGMADDFGSAVRGLVQGKPGRGIDVLEHMTPGNNLWYARLAVDRLLFDKLHTALDPNYRQSFARREQALQKAYGQKFWFRPGETTPGRGPNLGAAFGAQ